MKGPVFAGFCAAGGGRGVIAVLSATVGGEHARRLERRLSGRIVLSETEIGERARPVGLLNSASALVGLQRRAPIGLRVLAMFGIFWWPLTDRYRRLLLPSDEVLTIREVAALLKVGEKTAYTMAQSGDLPGFKVRGQWRFLRADLDAWIRERVEQAKTARDDEGGDK